MNTRDHLEQGRQLYEMRAWKRAYESLSRADGAAPLAAGDLELLATAAAMIGRDDEYLSALERAHHAYLDGGDTLRAARCAFWVALFSSIRGEPARATGWFGRVQRLVERERPDCVEQGYLLVPAAMALEEAGDYDAAFAIAVEVAEIGERFEDADLVALALHEQSRLLGRQGRIAAGLELLDEVLVTVSSWKLSPFLTGLIYCSVIEGCQQVYELGRAREWTAALTRWCEEQPELVTFTGRCLVHRAEIMQVEGSWPGALEQARRAGKHFAQVLDQTATGEAFYRQAEIHRLRGEHAAAEEAYLEASRCGWEPQPGLALLRLAQGDHAAAAAAIRRVVAATTEPLQRAGLLPTFVEVMLEIGDREEARRACAELEELTEGFRGGMLGAMVAHTAGAVALAEGDASAALLALRDARRMWQELGAPYEAARARVLLGLACRALGDEDTCAMELEAARTVFARLEAAPDVARVAALARGAAPGDTHGLTERELQVLRLVAAGETNKAIAAALVLSERTVDRHVSNILTKLRVPSRTAATAYAYEHELV